MSVLFMAPLQIVLNAQPLATQAYSLQNAQSAQNQLRSAAFHQEQTASLSLQTTLPLMALYSAPAPATSSFLEINVDSVAIYNGFDYYHSAQSRNSSLQTMWFASDKNTNNKLSPTQQQILKTVSRQEGQLQVLMKNGGVAVGVYNYYDCGGNDDMAFYFPTYMEDSYSFLTQTIDRTLYQTLTASYNATGSPYLLVSNASRPSLAQKIVSLCRLRTSVGATSGYTCVDVDALGLNSMLMEEATGTLNYYLLSPSTGSSNATIIDNLTAGDGTVTAAGANTILEDIMPYRSLSAFVSADQSPSLLTLRASSKTYYMLPLRVWEESGGFGVGWIVGEGVQGSSSADVQSTNVLSASLNTLLIPTLILMVISLVISVVVLRFLMNGLDL
jgi:hypothetical protein